MEQEMYSVNILDRNKTILETILRWRIITVENLMDVLNYQDKVKKFNQKIYRLEKYGLIKSSLHNNCKKVIYPSTEFMQFSGLAQKGLINQDNVLHDACVTAVVTSFLKYDLACSVDLPHEYKTKSTWKHYAIEPDAILKLKQGDEFFTIALEVELWRKDRKRVYEKMADYAKAIEYDYVFYFFADEFSFNSYVLRLKELTNDSSYSFLKVELLDKVVLVWNPFKENRVTDLRESKVYHNENYKKLCELIGL